MGLFEPRAAAWNVEGIPSSFSFGEIEADWDRMGGYLETAMKRVPATLQTGAKHFFCGPESFTPDLNPILGEAPEVPNYFVAAGKTNVESLIVVTTVHWQVFHSAIFLSACTTPCFLFAYCCFLLFSDFSSSFPSATGVFPRVHRHELHWYPDWRRSG